MMMVSGAQMARCCQVDSVLVASKPMKAPSDDVADDDDDEIGGQVVGAMVVHFLAATLAAVTTFRKDENSLPSPQFGHLPQKPFHMAFQSGRAGRPEWCSPPKTCLAFHSHLLLRPRGCEARSRVFLPPFDLWNERFDPGRGFGSLSISKRIAPASGATSTSLTSTRSAS